MFLHLLSPEQQALFCRAALQVILSDEVLHERERELQDAILREVDVTEFPDKPGDRETLLEDLKILDSALSRRVFLLELTGVAIADKDLHPEELRFLELVRERLGASEDSVETFVSFAERAHDLYDDGRMLVFESNTRGAWDHRRA